MLHFHHHSQGPEGAKCKGAIQESLNLIVISGDGPTLVGRNWLRHIQLNWKQIKAIVAESSLSLAQVLNRPGEIFKDELGNIIFEAIAPVEGGCHA